METIKSSIIVMGSKYREVPLKVEYHQNSCDYDPVKCVIERGEPETLHDGEIPDAKQVR